MNPDWWPLAQLRLETAGLELRVPTESDLYALAGLAALGVHDPQDQPFAVPWTDASPSERARSTLQYQWRQWGHWAPERWALELAVVREGVVVGIQSMSAENFAVLREVSTGSWLGLDYQGQGIGTGMRAAVLHLAFAGLGADFALSGAFTDNPASLAVSRKLGYVEDGVQRELRRDKPAVTQRLRLDRATWQATARVPVTIHGLEPCRAMFGLPASAGSDYGDRRLDDLRVVRSHELTLAQQDQVADIYARAFPPELRVPFAELATPGPSGLMHVAVDGTEPVGFAATMLLGQTGWAFLRYYGVSATLRRQGIGRRFWRLLLAALESRGRPARIVFEVEHPREVAADPAEQAVREARIAFWERCGARLLPVDGYVMPDLAGLAAPEPMLLMAYDAASGSDLDPGQVSGLVAALYSCRYGLDGTDPMVVAALRSIGR